MSDTNANGPRLIKKYPNRRLYDTVKSTYITLEELAELVRSGERVQVMGAKSGDDLTRQVLTQVILEEKGRLELIPVELLHYVIQVQDTNMAAPFGGFLDQAFSQFHELGDVGVGAGMEAATAGMQMASKMATQWADAWMSTMKDGLGEAEPAASAQEAPAAKEPASAESIAAAAKDELINLRGRMESLLDRLQQDE